MEWEASSGRSTSTPRPRWSSRSSARPSTCGSGGPTRPTSTRCPAPPASIVFGDPASPEATVSRSRWSRSTRPGGSPSGGPSRRGRPRRADNSLLVTFELTPVGRAGPAAHDRDRLPGEGLGGRRARGAVPRARRRLGLLPAPPRRPYAARLGAAAMSRRRRRRAVVGDRRPDPPPDARPAAGRRRRHGDVAERAAARHPPGGGQAPRRARPGRPGPRHAGGPRAALRVDEAQLARAVAQLASVGSTWDARLRRIKRIAEAIERQTER